MVRRNCCTLKWLPGGLANDKGLPAAECNFTSCEPSAGRRTLGTPAETQDPKNLCEFWFSPSFTKKTIVKVRKPLWNGCFDIWSWKQHINIHKPQKLPPLDIFWWPTWAVGIYLQPPLLPKRPEVYGWVSWRLVRPLGAQAAGQAMRHHVLLRFFWVLCLWKIDMKYW